MCSSNNFSHETGNHDGLPRNRESTKPLGLVFVFRVFVAAFVFRVFVAAFFSTPLSARFSPAFPARARDMLRRRAISRRTGSRAARGSALRQAGRCGGSRYEKLFP